MGQHYWWVLLVLPYLFSGVVLVFITNKIFDKHLSLSEKEANYLFSIIWPFAFCSLLILIPFIKLKNWLEGNYDKT